MILHGRQRGEARLGAQRHRLQHLRIDHVVDMDQVGSEFPDQGVQASHPPAVAGVQTPEGVPGHRRRRRAVVAPHRQPDLVPGRERVEHPEQVPVGSAAGAESIGEEEDLQGDLAGSASLADHLGGEPGGGHAGHDLAVQAQGRRRAAAAVEHVLVGQAQPCGPPGVSPVSNTTGRGSTG